MPRSILLPRYFCTASLVEDELKDVSKQLVTIFIKNTELFDRSEHSKH